MIGVAWQGDTKSYNAFVARHALTFPQALDVDGQLFQHFAVPAQPAWVFVKADGTSTRHLGAIEPAELAKSLGSLAG